MASGKTHEKINIFFILILIIFATLFLSIHGKLLGSFILGYLIGTFWMNPDVDIESRPYNRWLIFKYIWKPYQLLGHRSVWTHGYIISDIIRYIYLFIFLGIIVYLLEIVLAKNLFEIVFDFAKRNKEILIAVFSGNVISSSVHTFTDKISTRIKRRG